MLFDKNNNNRYRKILMTLGCSLFSKESERGTKQQTKTIQVRC